MNNLALTKINYGLYVIAANHNGRLNAQIANTVFQVTSEPAQLAISVNKQNLTHEILLEGGVFSVSVISTEATMEFIGKFGFKSGRNSDKFKETGFKTGHKGVPIVTDYALAAFEASVTSKLDVGTHTIFVGRIVNCEILSDAEPMTYDYYHRVKKGFSPKTAPTFIKQETKREEKTMKKYRCTVCGYIYDPQVGDPDSGIKPGTAFEDIPSTWVCPVCGVEKSSFEPA